MTYYHDLKGTVHGYTANSIKLLIPSKMWNHIQFIFCITTYRIRHIIFLPMVWRKAHTNDVSMDINDMVQGIKKL